MATRVATEKPRVASEMARAMAVVTPLETLPPSPSRASTRAPPAGRRMRMVRYGKLLFTPTTPG
jgi:hypothetical protein